MMPAGLEAALMILRTKLASALRSLVSAKMEKNLCIHQARSVLLAGQQKTRLVIALPP
jgi:hypothetical protein